jgi:hypothetical protein
MSFKLRGSQPENLVQLLVSNLNSVALLALVLQESKSSDSEEAEDCDVACIEVVSLCPPRASMCGN